MITSLDEVEYSWRIDLDREIFLVGMIVILDNYPSGMTPPSATSKYLHGRTLDGV